MADDWKIRDCGDRSCILRGGRGGMRTQGGCKHLKGDGGEKHAIMRALGAEAERLRAENERLILALRNVRALAAQMQSREARGKSVPDAAAHLLRFCADVGVTGEILRGDEADRA